jgi:hypothetical protein
MKKEDYMNLSKERLAELLAERDAMGMQGIGTIPTDRYAGLEICRISGGYCSNPFHDCINCANHGNSGFYTTSTNTLITKD